MKCVKHDVFRTIEQIYHHGDFNYVLYNYVDNEIWAKRIAAQIPNIQVDNLTDFNYAKCFTLFIVPSVLPGIRLGTDKFKSYIKKILI